MVGVHTKFANVFVGGLFLNPGQTNTSNFDNSQGETVDYEVRFESSRWNVHVGFNLSSF